jgi:peptide/nickel transport system permease protein
MLSFLVRRIAQAFAVMLVVAAVAFVLFQFIGDPVSQMLPMDASPADRAALAAALGLDSPWYVQFARFLGNAAQGDFGISLRQAAPVSRLIAERLPATLELALSSVILATAVGIPAGVYAAISRKSAGAKFVMGASLLGISLPTFLIGILLILVFSVWLGWMPAFGRGEVVSIGGWTTGLASADGLRHLVLPAVTLSVFQVALIIRLVRSEMLEVLRSDFIKFARARGLSSRSICFVHALKNTLLPVITITGLQLGGIIAFSIVTETVFQWPGMGLLFLQSVQFADIPVLTAYLCLIALVFVLINLCVDLLYMLVDPRLRIQKGS